MSEIMAALVWFDHVLIGVTGVSRNLLEVLTSLSTLQVISLLVVL